MIEQNRLLYFTPVARIVPWTVKRESLEIVEEEVSTPAEIDRIFQVLLGTRGGPFRMMDKVGLDVARNRRALRGNPS